MVFSLDTSALLKLVVAEPETVPLRSWLTAADRLAAAAGNGVAVLAPTHERSLREGCQPT